MWASRVESAGKKDAASSSVSSFETGPSGSGNIFFNIEDIFIGMPPAASQNALIGGECFKSIFKVAALDNTSAELNKSFRRAQRALFQKGSLAPGGTPGRAAGGISFVIIESVKSSVDWGAEN
jgi:hypothetical protein